MVITSRSFARVCGVAPSLRVRRWRCGSQTLRPTLHRLVACTVTVAAVCATAAQAQLNNPDIWLQNPGSTAFGVGTNWSKGTVPTAVNDVRVDSTSTRFPVLVGGSYSTGPVYLSYDGGSQTSSLTIQNGGTLNTSLNSQGAGVVMAIQPSTSATITATGAGSQLTTTGSIWVGTEGSGTLNILDGAKVQSQGRDVAIGLGFTPTGTGSALVTGAGSVLSVAGALIVGSSAAGSLNVANQATVNAGNAFIGQFSGGVGALTISNQAAVSFSTLTLAFSLGGQGALNIGASPGSAPRSPGTLTAGNIFFGNGTGVINFNHTANNYVFATDIIGAGSVNLLSGTTILAGDNSSYTGNTHLNGGIAAVSNEGNLGAGALGFDGGTLEVLAAGGGITLNNAVTLNAGGGTFLADAGTTSTLSGAIRGNGSLDKAGLGILVLSGVNNYGGATIVSSGTLLAGSSTALSAKSAFTVNSLLDLNGFNNTVGSLSGNGTVTNNGREPATLTVGGNNTSTTFSGTLTDGISSLGLNKTGMGTMILTGSNTYTGGTTISAGALQIGDGGLTGSIIGNVTDNGTLVFNRSNTLSFGAVISGTGNVQQNGAGTTVLSGPNTYIGGTILNAGTLTANGAQALGLGDVQVNGGTLRADSQPIKVKGNYTQNAGGTLQLSVGGSAPSQHDFLNVSGHAVLGGTLQLIALNGFQPKISDQLTLVTAGGGISGKFVNILDPFSPLIILELVYGQNSLELEFSLAFALTANQRAAANLVEQVEDNPRAAELNSFLSREPFSNLPGDLEKISPDGLTSFYEIGFSNANIQRLNLESRLDDLRSGSNGFSSNMKVNGATVNLEDKAIVEGKSAKNAVERALQPAAENRWGVWVTGFGDFVNVDSDSNAKGYDFTTGGMSLGVDYRITDQLAMGVMGEYAHTWTSLQPSGDIDVDSGRGGVYATWFNHGIYLNGAIYGGHNVYSSSRSSLGGFASGGTGGEEFSTFISGGYDFHLGDLTVGPIASLQYTYINIDGFSEKGSPAALQFPSQSVESLRIDFGLRAFYLWQIGKITVEPFLRAAWEHEFKYSALPITAGFDGIAGPSATFFGPSEGHESAIVSAGVSVGWTPTIATYVNYDGQLGRDRYNANAVTGGVKIRF